MKTNGTIKACVHCVSLQTDENGKLVCGLEIAVDKFDLVRGFRPQMSAYAMRANGGKCGPDGKLWQEQLLGVRDTIEAARVSHGQSALVQVGRLATNVVCLPGDLAVSLYRGARARAKRFAERVSAARAGWHSIQDNAAPKLLTAEPDPIAEAQTVIDKVEPELFNPEVPPKADPVPLAVATDPRKEAAAAQAVALAVGALLFGYICAGMLALPVQGEGDTRRTCCEKSRNGEPARCYPCPNTPSRPVKLDDGRLRFYHC